MSIQRRSVLYVKNKNKPYRFIGWAVVTTTLGAMLEPFDIASHHVASEDWKDFDHSDVMARVDDLQNVTDEHGLITSLGEDMVLMGGERHPRVLAYDGNN